MDEKKVCAIQQFQINIFLLQYKLDVLYVMKNVINGT